MLLSSKRRESPDSSDDVAVGEESRISESSLRSKKFSPFSVDSLLFKKESVDKSTNVETSNNVDSSNNVDNSNNVEQPNRNDQRTPTEVVFDLQNEHLSDPHCTSSDHQESNNGEITDLYDEETGKYFLKISFKDIVIIFRRQSYQTFFFVDQRFSSFFAIKLGRFKVKALFFMLQTLKPSSKNQKNEDKQSLVGLTPGDNPIK